MLKTDSIRTSEVLQGHFANSNQSAMLKLAELVIRLDVSDCDDSVGDQLSGIERGIKLWTKLTTEYLLHGVPNTFIYKVTFNDYADDDGVALFIGTEQSLMALFLANQS